MITQKVKVTWKNPDGTKGEEHIEVQVFGTLQEAAEHLSPEIALKYLNTQYKTSKMNEFRATKVQPKPTKEATRMQAMKRITTAEWVANAGDEVKLQALIAKYMAQVEAEQAEAAKAETNGASTEEEEDDTAEEAANG